MSDTAVKNSDIPEVYNMFGEVYSFYKSNYRVPSKDKDKYYERVLIQAENITQKYKSSLCDKIVLALVEELQERCGNNG